mmetsp:Transcript_17998/g.59261  ORF Transcript_17998/g.59261 Transcript_17998/m.59261 type:complete len:287 (-) Transcript_17998:627-1487(-)
MPPAAPPPIGSPLPTRSGDHSGSCPHRRRQRTSRRCLARKISPRRRWRPVPTPAFALVLAALAPTVAAVARSRSRRADRPHSACRASRRHGRSPSQPRGGAAAAGATSLPAAEARARHTSREPPARWGLGWIRPVRAAGWGDIALRRVRRGRSGYRARGGCGKQRRVGEQKLRERAPPASEVESERLAGAPRNRPFCQSPRRVVHRGQPRPRLTTPRSGERLHSRWSAWTTRRLQTCRPPPRCRPRAPTATASPGRRVRALRGRERVAASDGLCPSWTGTGHREEA